MAIVEVGKSFLALEGLYAINEGLKPFFWSIEDKNQAILERIKNIENFYPFNIFSSSKTIFVPKSGYAILSFHNKFDKFY